MDCVRISLDVAPMLGAVLVVIAGCSSPSSSDRALGVGDASTRAGDSSSGMHGDAGPPDGERGKVQGFADGGPESMACAHFYSAQYLRCGGPTRPATAEAHFRARFVHGCLDDMALTGSGMVPASVEACASALAASPCDLPDGWPPVCDFRGSLSSGAPCNAGLQCASGWCEGTIDASPGGQIGPVTCGTCGPLAAVGEVCGAGACPAGSICMTKDTTAASPNYTCTPIVRGAEGSPCDDLAAICETGLYCSARAGTCTPLGIEGAACGEAARDYAGGCEPPLGCVGLPGSRTCSAGSVGAFCLTDTDCARGLGCVPGPCTGPVARIGCAPSGKCEPVKWASPGEPCDDAEMRCLVGQCSGVCPPVISDGASCSVQGVGSGAGAGPACDAFAECFHSEGPAGTTGPYGICTVIDESACR
jgi:hypothetical protein